MSPLRWNGDPGFQMNLLYPKLRWRWLPPMLGCSLIGALWAGAYGIIHDQITWTISPEYFTRLKFDQFQYADLGFPPRVFVAEIGFLASWWVGFIGAWFLSRLTVPAFPPPKAFRLTLQGFVILFMFAVAGSTAGFLYGFLRAATGYPGWEEIAATLGVQDVSGFVRVAYIHNGSYLGGIIGLLAAITYILRVKRREMSRPSCPALRVENERC